MSTRKAAAKRAEVGGAVPVKTLEQLIAENRRLAEELESARETSAALESAVKQAQSGRDNAVKELDAANKKLAALEKQTAELKEANRTLVAQAKRLTAQVERDPTNPLTAVEAARLFDDFLGGVRLSRGLEIRDVELTLKVGAAKLGELPVLLLPEPGAIEPALLHELRFTLKSGAPLSGPAIVAAAAKAG